MEYDRREYFQYVSQGVSGKLTRGLVVSTEDPLYAGRVKVWIPILHGGFNSEVDAQASTYLGDNEGSDRLGKISATTIECLPWASVLCHNWAPTTDADFTSDTCKNNFGIINIPKVGTEVFIIFEDDSPNMPVIIGSALHESEALKYSQIKSLELSPGLLISDPASNDEQKQQEYPTTISESYIIRGEKGSQLCLSEITGQEQILLGGAVDLKTKPVIVDDGDPKSKYSLFLSGYPNFPTTASAPLVSRQSIYTGTSQISLNIASANSGAPVSMNDEHTAEANQLAGVAAVNADATSTSTPEATKLTKRVPIPCSWPPVKYTDPRAFGYDRGYEVHQGIDLSVKLVDIVAPINCVALAYQDSSTAGKYLIVKGEDGYCHAFLHADSILPQIIQDINAGIYKKYAVGTKLGVTGRSGGDWHLHWEVFTGDGIVNRQTALAKRETLRKQKPHGTIGFLDPLKTWLGSDNVVDSSGNPVQSQVLLSAAQIQGYSAVVNANNDSSLSRPIGLEISLVPGAEQIFLRHSSGGYAGFDADGNWKVYTPGNAEFRVNRNLVFDVLGGIMSSCLAFWSKAKTVTNFISVVAPKLWTNFELEKLPKVFKRMEETRQKDMEDALRSSGANIYYNLVDSTLGKSLEQINTDRFAAKHTPSERNYSCNKWDSLIVAAHAKYIPQNHPLASVLTPKLMKAVMLQESNGEEKAGKGSYVGLFQLGAGAIKDITKQNTVNIEDYRVAAPNIEVGVQFVRRCCEIMYATIPSNLKSDLSENDKLDIVMSGLMGYNWGPYGIRGLYRTVVTQSNTIAYAALEERFVNSTLYTRNATKGTETLNYAPNIMYIYKRISI